MFNVSFDSSSVNMFSSSLPHLLPKLERSNVLSQLCDKVLYTLYT